MLSSLKDFFKLIRWFHELLGLFPFVTLYEIIRYELQKSGRVCLLPPLDFILLCLCVQFLMMSGFILNDIKDRHIDRINKPNTRIVERKISLLAAKRLFVIVSILALIFSVYITCFVFKEWAFISTAVYLLSVSYNLFLKRSPLFGNIAIAALSAFVPLVIMFFAKDCLEVLNNNKIYTLIYIYALFPFLIIIPRELSLDISDMEGDKADGCRTLPIVIGAKKSKMLVMILIFLTVLFSLPLMYNKSYLILTFSVVDVLLIYYTYKLTNTEMRIDYVKNGRLLWFAMLLGLVGATVATVY